MLKACCSPLAHGSSGFTSPRSTQQNGTAIDMSAASSMISRCRHVFCQMNVKCEDILPSGMCFSYAVPRFALSSSCCVNPTARDLLGGSTLQPRNPYIKQRCPSFRRFPNITQTGKKETGGNWKLVQGLNSGATAVDVDQLDQALSLHQVTRPEAECHCSCGRGLNADFTRRL